MAVSEERYADRIVFTLVGLETGKEDRREQQHEVVVSDIEQPLDIVDLAEGAQRRVERVARRSGRRAGQCLDRDRQRLVDGTRGRGRTSGDGFVDVDREVVIVVHRSCRDRIGLGDRALEVKRG